MPSSTPARDWSSAQAALREIQAVVPSLADLPEPGPATAPALLCRLATTVEELRRRGLRDQIQLVSLQETTESLLREHDPDRILVSLTAYLRAMLDLQAVLIFRRLPGEADWTGYRAASDLPAGERIGSWSADALAARLPSTPRAETDRAGQAAAPDPSDPRHYAVVLPLSSAGDSATFPRPAGNTNEPIGWLCLTPASPEAAEESWRPLEIARRAEGILRTLAHRQAREGEARFRRQLLQAMDDGLLAVDRDERIVECNAAAGDALALPPLPPEGTPLDRIHRRAPTLERYIRSSLRDDAEPSPQEMVLGTASGTLPLKVAACRMRNDTGQISGVVVNLTDLTEVRAMENEIRRLDRLAALGRFAAGMAHEIRNPLAGIEAGIEYLAGRLSGSPRDQDDVRMLQAEIRRLDRIVSDLLDYTRPRPLEHQVLEASALLERIRLALTPLLLSRRVRLCTGGEAGLLLWADPDRLEQVLLNLVKNAVEASPEGDEVRVSWERITRPARRRRGSRGGAASPEGGSADPAGAAAGPGPLRFRVEDHGSGMGPQELAHVFEPFYTTKGKGTGLGLSLSQTIIEQHGGRLLLESVPGQGTIAVCELPAARTERKESHALVHPHRG